MNPGSMTPREALAALGAKDMPDALQKAAERFWIEAQQDAERLLLPDDPTRAQAAIDRAQARLNGAVEDERVAQARVDEVKAKVQVADDAVTSADRAATMAADGYAVALDLEREAFASGAETIDVDVAGAKAAVEAAQRRVSVLRAEAAKTKQPLAAAQVALDGAVARRKAAKFYLVQAQLVAAAAEQCKKLQDVVKPLLDDADAAARGDYPESVSALRSISGIRRAVAYALDGTLPQECLRVLPDAPRRMAAAALAARNDADDDTPKIAMVVAPAESYGKFRAGQRVLVTPEEAALQSRRDPRSGQRLGALETVADFEARQEAAAKQAIEDRESPKFKQGLISRMIDDGMARIRSEAMAKAEAKAAEEQRARQDRELRQLALQKLVDSTVDREAALARGE